MSEFAEEQLPPDWSLVSSLRAENEMLAQENTRMRWELEGMRKLKTHDAAQCSGEHCCIHNPSEHHMRTWPLNWRDDTGMMERICQHGRGHPDPDDIAYKIRAGHKHTTAHGCDGCCHPDAGARQTKIY